ncbi:MAG: putative manganese-dependent inorganic diphosphatase, partial [Peptococcaceae bacterium]|nr:putative manganese-dependent inorganic diphosphatase [Peptococcaceae bacterium]
MDKPVYIIGHKNPDTDSICAALAYAALKRELGHNAIACRAGEINRETQYVLDYFNQAAPLLLPDLHTRVKDLLHDNNATITPDVPLREAWLLMRAQGSKALAVVDKAGHLLGLVTGGDLADKYLVDLGEQDLDDLHVTVANVLTTLSGCLIVGAPQAELKGKVVIGAMQSKTLEQFLAPNCVVIVGDREDGQLAALEAGASCLIITGGMEVSSKVDALAKARGTIVVSVPMDTFAAARLILTSIPVGSMMRTTNLVVFQEDDLLDEVRKVMLETRFRNYPVVDEQNRVVGGIARYNLLAESKHKVILVDHNEFGQAIEGIDEAQILEVVDHHRVGGIQTGEPILFRNEPLGSTCTLIAKAYFEHDLTPTASIAGIMCAAILSDTAIFKSPTSTQTDRAIAQRLAELAGIDPVPFGTAMFQATSSLSGRTPAEILLADYKEFAVGELR